MLRSTIKYISALVLGAILGTAVVASAAPLYRVERTLLPESSTRDEIGTSTRPWFRGFFSNLFVQGEPSGCAEFDANGQITSSGSPCGTGGGGGGGSAGAWATTTNNVLTYLTTQWSALIGGTATTSDARLSVVGSTTVTGTGMFGGELRVPNIVATSTTATSSFPVMYSSTSTISNLNGVIYVDGVRFAKTGAGINSALTQCNALGGGNVQLPQGTTTVTTQIVLKPYCILTGNPSGSVLQMASGANLDPLISGSYVDYAGIKNITVDYNHQNNPSSSVGMQVASSSHFSLDGNIFQNMKGFAIGLVGNSYSRNHYAYVNNNKVLNPLVNPNDLLLVVSDDGIVTNNYVGSSTANISLVLYESDNLYASGNIIELTSTTTGATGIGMLSLTNSTVIGNKVTGTSTTYTGICISVLTEFDNVSPIPEPSRGNTIIGNTCKHVDVGIEFRDTSEDVARDNRLETLYRSFQFPLGATAATNIYIRNNDVDQSAVINNPVGATRIWYKDNAVINITTHEDSGAEYQIRTVTSGANANIDSGRDNTLIIKKTVGSATAVTLADGNVVEHGKTFYIKDGKGDAATNPITITGNGGQTIDGRTSFTISNNYGSVYIQWNGDEWNILDNSTQYFISNFGIGTSSPYAKLSVVGETVSAFFTATTTSVNTFPQLAFTNATGTSLFASGSSTLQNFNSASSTITKLQATNIGIGTFDQTERLSVIGEGTGKFKVGSAGFGSNYVGVSVGGTLDSTSYNFLGSPTDGTLYINRPSTKNMLFRENNSTQMTLAGSTGNLGIGTTSPYAKLSVAGHTVTGTLLASSTATPGIQVGDGTTGSLRIGDVTMSKTGGSYMNYGGTGIMNISGLGVNVNATNVADELYIIGNGSGQIVTVDQNGGTQGTGALFAIEEAGNVGIGTSSPYSKLSVAGPVVAESFTATSTTASTTLFGLFSVQNTATSSFLGGINIESGCFSVKGVCVGGSASLFGYPFTNTSYGGSTSTLLHFSNGIISLASSTMQTLMAGNATSTTLEVTNQASTTNLIVSRKVGIQSSNNTTFALDVGGQIRAGCPGGTCNGLAYIVGDDAAISDINTSNQIGLSGAGGTGNGGIRFGASGGPVVFGTTAGLLGVATITPITTLHVSGASTLPSGELGSMAITTTHPQKRLIMGVDTTGTMYSWIQSVENGIANRVLALNANGGNVAIGTTTAAEKLQVNGNIRIDSNSALGSNMTLSDASTYGEIQTFNSNPLVLNRQGNNILVATTTNPSSDKFHIKTSGAGLGMLDQTANAGYMRMFPSAGLSYIQTGLRASTGSSGNLLFTNIGATTEFMRLTATGSLGIGTSTPSGLLAVQGNMFVATSGTSTFMGSLNVQGLFQVGTSSIMLRGDGTSTFSNGIDITSGCLRVNGTCISAGTPGSGASSTLLADGNNWTGLQNFTVGADYNGWRLSTTTTVCASGCEYTSIQTAINDGYKHIQLKPETYAGPVSITQSETFLEGAGHGSLITCDATATGQGLCVSVATSSLLTRIKITDLAINNTNGTNAGVGLDTSQTSHLVVENVRISNFELGHLYQDGTSNNSFYSSFKDMIYFDNSSCFRTASTSATTGGNLVNANSMYSPRCRIDSATGIGYDIINSEGWTFYSPNAEPASVIGTGMRIDGTSLGITVINPWFESNATGTEILSGAATVKFFGGRITAGTVGVYNRARTSFDNTLVTANTTNFNETGILGAYWNATTDYVSQFFGLGTTTPSSAHQRIGLQLATSDADADAIVINNSGAFATAPAAIQFTNSTGGFSKGTARIVANPGSGYTNANFAIQVADSAKALQSRLTIDVNGVTSMPQGLIALASSTFQTLCIASDCRTSWPSAGGGTWPWSVQETFNVSANATTSPMWMRGALYASSTVIFGNGEGTELTWNSATGHLGINGTTTPWGDVSILMSSDTQSPAFVGATTSGGLVSWFWNSTTTKSTNPFNWMFGTSSNKWNRNGLVVAGEIRSTLQNYTCEPYVALTADITADSPTITTSASQLCGGLMFDELTDGALYIATTSPIIVGSGRLISESPMWAIRANELAGAAANEGYAIRMPRNIVRASSTPYMEVLVKKHVVTPAFATNASSTLGFVGFESGALNGTTRCGDGAGAIGCMGFVSSSTGNWMALTSTRAGVQANTLTDTGVSSTTVGFIGMRVELENGGTRVKYLMRHSGSDEWRLVAEHTTNIPSNGLTPAIVVDADLASGARPEIVGKGPIYWGAAWNTTSQ